MRTGSELKRALESRRDEARSALSDARRRQGALLAEQTQRQSELATAIRRMAEVRQEAADHAEAFLALGRADAALAASAGQRARERQRLEGKLAELEPAISSARQGLESRSATTVAAEAAATAAVQTALESIATTADWQAAQRAHAEAEAVLEEAKQPLAKWIATRDALVASLKTRPFAYLVRVGYGSEAYTARGLVAWADRLLARWSGYPGARAKLALLDGLIAQAQARVGESNATLSSAVEVLADIEEAAIASSPAAGLLLAAEAASGDQAAAEESLAALEHELATAQQAIEALAACADQQSQASLRRAVEAISDAADSTLRAAARETAASEDDAIAEQIIACRRDLAELVSRVDNADALVREHQRAADRAEDVLARVRSHGMLGHRSRFRAGVDLPHVLEAVIAGHMTADAAAGQLKQRHWIERPVEVSSSSSSMPGFGLSSSSRSRSGFGGGGFKSGGGFGGGGFKTGGGF